MSEIALLMGLLLLSYLGSLLLEGKAARGLPSGVEYVGLGFVVGPRMLGLVERAMIDDFEPIVQVALGWIAFVVGLDFGRVEGRRVPARSMGIGIACALATGGTVAVATDLLLDAIAPLELQGGARILFAAGAGAVTAETTRFAAMWAGARWGAKGVVTKLLVELGASDDFAPLVAAGAIFAVVPAPNVTVALDPIVWFGVSLLLGAVLGIVTAFLLHEVEGYQVWGALIGTLLLGVGTAVRFGMCTIFVTFVMGIALAAASKSRRALRKMVGQTERAVLLPMLLLAGARIDPRPLFEIRALAPVVALVLLVRIIGKVLTGLVVRGLIAEARPAGPGLGIVLLSSGPMSISCAFVFALRFPGVVGDTLLVAAAISAVLGEIVSTFALKRLLIHVGEISVESLRRKRPLDRPTERPPSLKRA